MHYAVEVQVQVFLPCNILGIFRHVLYFPVSVLYSDGSLAIQL